MEVTEPQPGRPMPLKEDIYYLHFPRERGHTHNHTTQGHLGTRQESFRRQKELRQKVRPQQSRAGKQHRVGSLNNSSTLGAEGLSPVVCTPGPGLM